MEMDRMPGVFRDYHYHDMAMRSKNNQGLAKSYGMPVETFLRISNAGNDMFMMRTGRPESDPPEGYTPDIPGNTFGVDISDIEITVS